MPGGMPTSPDLATTAAVMRRVADNVERVIAGARDQVEAAIDQAWDLLGDVDAVVNTAGTNIPNRSGAELRQADWDLLLAVNLNFIAFSHFLGDLAGQVFVFFILTVAAAESAIGLAILVVLFRNLNTIDVEDLDSLKG